MFYDFSDTSKISKNFHMNVGMSCELFSTQKERNIIWEGELESNKHGVRLQA